MYRPAIIVAALIAVAAGLLIATRGGATQRSPTMRPSNTAAPPTVHAPSVDAPAETALPAPPKNKTKPAPAPEVRYSTLSSSDADLAASPPADEVVPEEPATPSGPPNERWARFQRDSDDYLFKTLAPRARDCWKRIDGQGRIEFLYLMRHESGRGVGRITPTTDIGVETPVSIVESELAPEQAKQALDCMLDAIEGTSFSSELPTPGETLVGMYQGWQVGTGLAKE